MRVGADIAPKWIKIAAWETVKGADYAVRCETDDWAEAWEGLRMARSQDVGMTSWSDPWYNAGGVAFEVACLSVVEVSWFDGAVS